MVLIITGDSFSGKTQKACEYASNRQPVLIADYSRGFVKGFHDKNLTDYHVLNGQSLESDKEPILEIINRGQIKSIILDGGFGYCFDIAAETTAVRDIINASSEKGIDVYITLVSRKCDVPMEKVAMITKSPIKELIEKYPIIRLEK